MIFNFSRQILYVTTYAISQEITILVGNRNWAALRRLYDLSERVVLFLVTTVSIGALLMCPAAFSLWLHKRSLYEPGLCLLMAMVSAVMGIKDHKVQFQWSSNQHQRLAVVSVFGYLGMCGLAAVTLRPFGIAALMVLWLAAEIVQAGWILRLNKVLFPPEIHVSMAPVLRALAMLTVCFSLLVWPIYHSAQWSLGTTVGVAIGAVSVLSVVSYFVFGLREVQTLLRTKLRSHFAAAG